MTQNLKPLAFSCAQAATLAQVSPGLIRKLIRAGKIKGVRIGKCWRVPKSEVLRICGGEHEEKKSFVVSQTATAN
jgi:excisionase family DNA binding protein